MPFPRDHLERALILNFCGLQCLAGLARVDTIGNLFPRLIPPPPGLGQAHFGVSAQGDQLLLTPKPVFEAPPFTPGRGNQQEKAVGIKYFKLLAFWALRCGLWCRSVAWLPPAYGVTDFGLG